MEEQSKGSLLTKTKLHALQILDRLDSSGMLASTTQQQEGNTDIVTGQCYVEEMLHPHVLPYTTAIGGGF